MDAPTRRAARMGVGIHSLSRVLIQGPWGPVTIARRQHVAVARVIHPAAAERKGCWAQKISSHAYRFSRELPPSAAQPDRTVAGTTP